MVGNKPRICGSITSTNQEAIARAESLVDLFEVRIDLIGKGWRKAAAALRKPWLACNRSAAEGGAWRVGESARIKALLDAVDLGAGNIDIELAAPDIEKVVKQVKGRALCLISYHNFTGTPPLDELREIVQKELAAGADICKVVTTANRVTDNITVLRLIQAFMDLKIVSFAMGAAGQLSRALAPLVGGYFTYASLEVGRESAAGQLTVQDMRTIYEVLGYV